MFDAIERFARRRPRVVCFGLTSLLPALSVLSVPISYWVVLGNNLGFQVGLSFANSFSWVTGVQIALVVVSFTFGWHLLPTPAERVWNIVWCFLSVLVVFACGVVSAILFIP